MTGRSGVRAAQWAALLVGVLALAVTVAEVPLARLARQSVLASGGSLPFPFSLAYGVAGLLVAWRKPGNVIGWLMLGAAASGRPARAPASTWWPTTGCMAATCRSAGWPCWPSPAGRRPSWPWA